MKTNVSCWRRETHFLLVAFSPLNLLPLNPEPPPRPAPVLFVHYPEPLELKPKCYNIQSMFAEAAVHLNLLSVPLRCPAVITEQVVCRRFRAAEEICAQVVRSAASLVKSGFMGMENSALV